MSGVSIKYYGMFYKNEEGVHKKNKKKLAKKQILRRSNFEFIKYDDTNLIQSLIQYIQRVKKCHPSQIGIIFDTNIIIHDITYVPPFPTKFDILCLESELESYKKEKSQSVYWTPTNIKHSGNFIINGGRTLDNFLELAKLSNSAQDLFNKINSLNIFTITQHNFSEKQENYIHDPLIINKKLTDDKMLEYDKKLSFEFYNKFNQLNMQVNKMSNYKIKDELLPKISLICPFTNKNKLFHTLLTFLRLNYPKHLLELVIIDDSKSEKEMNLPEDSRIKLLNVNNSKEPNKLLPLGYKLNTAVKHSSNDLIMHFFDTNNYTLNLRDLISHFILSNKQCIMSKDTGLYNNNNQSNLLNIPDLANCIYTKDFWKKYSFEDLDHNLFTNCDLTYKWISYRINEVSFLPFVNMSFKLYTNENILLDTKECGISLSDLVDKKNKESFKLLLE